jgi:asparagine synthase (glutamine-hydrolysing)
MCGIAGIVHANFREPVPTALVERMTRKLQHRGPDDFGVWAQEGVGLGHQRLSIIDLAGGHQPMAVNNDAFYITYNGEIYNYIELKAILQGKGHAFNTQCDTEVLLQMYAAYGQDCLEQLNGMYAFALWDVGEKRLFAARDRLGIKPFYYYWDGAFFAFASEPKALLEHPRIVAEIDRESLEDYLNLQYCLGDKTLFKGIKRLLPGHCLSLQQGQLQIRQYWDVQFGNADDFELGDFTGQLQHGLRDAVKLRLRSDVPVGAHLSGGLDSSAISCLAAEELPGTLQVFTCGFKDADRYDETRYARLVGEHIGAAYHEYFPTAQDLADTFENLVYWLDEPVAGAAVFPQYFLSRLASENVKVVLGGQGGDELFCGYARYLVGYLESCLQRAIYGTAPMAGSVRLEDIAPNLDYLGGYEPMMQHFFADGLFTDPADRYYRLLLSTRRSQEMDDILRPDLKPPGYATHEVFRDSFMAPETDDLIDRMTYMDIKDHLQSLLHLEDRTSMAVSLESRLPLLDHRIVEQVFAVPAHERFAAGKPKFLLRQAIADWVPEPIMQRSDKMGFPVPIFEWFQGSMRPFVEDILLGQQTVQRGVFNAKAVERCLRAEKPFGRTVWGLLSLELWFRNFFD